jgi:hypothetical protein
VGQRIDLLELNKIVAADQSRFQFLKITLFFHKTKVKIKRGNIPLQHMEQKA